MWLDSQMLLGRLSSHLYSLEQEKMGMRELDLNLKDRRPILIGKEYVYMHKW